MRPQAIVSLTIGFSLLSQQVLAAGLEGSRRLELSGRQVDRADLRPLAHVESRGLRGVEPAAAEPESDEKKLERLYQAGQEHFDRAEYEQAAANWSEALGIVPETQATSSTRSMILLNALSAYMEAYRDTRELRHLRSAELLAENYMASLGGRTAIEAVLDARARISDTLEAAQAESTPQGSPGANSNDPGTATGLEGEQTSADQGPAASTGVPTGSLVTTAPTRRGAAWIVSGTVTAATGMAFSALWISGQVLRVQAEEVRDDETGELSNNLTAAGAVTNGVLVGLGVAMLIVGAKKRKRQRARGPMAIVPSIGDLRQGEPVGLSVFGRF